MSPIRLILIGFFVGVLSYAAETDGFVEIDSLDDLRRYAVQDAVKVRMKPGTYLLDQATPLLSAREAGGH